MNQKADSLLLTLSIDSTGGEWIGNATLVHMFTLLMPRHGHVIRTGESSRTRRTYVQL